jgi:CDGSH-type Zn-finger protein
LEPPAGFVLYFSVSSETKEGFSHIAFFKHGLFYLKGVIDIMAEETKPSIMAEKNDPLYIQNAKGLILLDSDGNPFEITDDEITLCRCGQSRNKPFCDDSHARTGFQSEVHAPKKPE